MCVKKSFLYYLYENKCQGLEFGKKKLKIKSNLSFHLSHVKVNM